MNHAFSESALRTIEPQVVQKIREWCHLLSMPKSNNSSKELEKDQSQWGEKRDMARWSGFLTTDVLSQVCFSQDIEACKNAGSVWDDTIAETMAMISRVSDYDEPRVPQINYVSNGSYCCRYASYQFAIFSIQF